jgi:hypothetical protein
MKLNLNTGHRWLSIRKLVKACAESAIPKDACITTVKTICTAIDFTDIDNINRFVEETYEAHKLPVDGVLRVKILKPCNMKSYRDHVAEVLGDDVIVEVTQSSVADKVHL